VRLAALANACRLRIGVEVNRLTFEAAAKAAYAALRRRQIAREQKVPTERRVRLEGRTTAIGRAPTELRAEQELGFIWGRGGLRRVVLAEELLPQLRIARPYAA
jgi:hypothetical protein